MTQLISLENVSVRFRIYHNPNPSLKDLFVNRLKQQADHDAYSEFFALNNVTLAIKPGDRLGLVGLNGAGKSTLLKTIAGIYPPHQGKLQVNGRITPLMELGAGFNPEQTGRQNIYLYGALLGYSPDEMKAKQEAIIEFSELQEFMDMPVKYFSSGMYGRLAFSIATITDPEILLIDEVFATGDGHFVQKSSQRIEHMVAKTRIVVLVTHNMDQIRRLCNRVVLLERGQVINDGHPKEIMAQYEKIISK